MIDVSISWDKLERNAESREISFESFNFQVAYLLYSSFGDFEYDYNTPGSEFYLHLTKDCPELKASAGQIVGWQAKFWLNPTAPENTRLPKDRRDMLVEAFAKSKEYKPQLVTWVICTPGQPLNTKPHCPKDALLAELARVDPNISVLFWSKPVYEAFFHQDYEKFLPLLWHYFGEHFLGREVCQRRTQATLHSLRERFDIDLYVRGSGDEEIWKLIHLDHNLGALNGCITELRRDLSFAEDRAESITKENAHSEDHYSALGELSNVSTDLARELVEYDDRLSTISQAAELARLFFGRWKEIVLAYRKVEQCAPDNVNPLWQARYLDRIIDKLVSVRSELNDLFQSDVHVLASAGYGKTCLACHIATKCLEEDIPAILLTGRQLSDSTPIPSQIITRLNLPNSWTLRNVFACLNNLGFLRRKKIPLIIDGLNETVPNCSRWKEELSDLIVLSREFRHVILITTVRTAYCERIFEAAKPKDVRNAIVLQGFTDYNVTYAVRRYFDKYRIVATNWSTSHKIFAHPLLLKMFCVVNEDSTVEISHAGVFGAVEQYVEHLAMKAASEAGDVNQFLLPILNDRIKDLALYLWKSNTRSVDYSTGLPSILDPKWDGSGDWRQTTSCKLLDEGLLLSREIRDGEEVAEFSFDLVAGLIIAKAVFFSGDRLSIDILTTQEVIQRLGNGVTPAEHPLAEDVLRALIYLWPKYSGDAQLIEVFDHPQCIQFSFEMLDVICATELGIAAVRQKVLELPRPIDELQLFSEGVIDSVLDHGCLSAVPILTDLLLELTAPQVDLIWSEALRTRRRTVSLWLKNFKPNTIPADLMVPVLSFLAMLCSSTFDDIRDRALLALVQLGRIKTDALLEVMTRLATISDFYILERLTAALCGVTLSSRQIDEIDRICTFLREHFIRHLRSPHLWILDYLDTIFAYSAHLTDAEYDEAWLEELPVCSWQIDKVAAADCTEERADWGYGPIDYDFARTYFRYLTHDSNHNPVSTKKEITCKMIYRMKEHGYDPVLFDDLDKRIAKESESERHYYLREVQTYCRKMSWITFHELCGQMLLAGTLTPGLGPFRLLYGEVDPTIPSRPTKRQLFTRCCVPHHTESVADWVERSEGTPYLDDLKIWRTNDGEAETVWLLVYGELRQSGRAKSKLYVSWNVLLCPREKEHALVDSLRSGRERLWSAEWSKLLAGEIPWRLGLRDVAEENHEGVGNIATEDVIEFYNWSSRAEVIENPAPVPFLHHRIALSSRLYFEPPKMKYIDIDGQLATRLFWDNTSTFLYVRKDVLETYCEANSYDLVYVEHSFKSAIPDGSEDYTRGLREDFYYSDLFDIGNSS